MYVLVGGFFGSMSEQENFDPRVALCSPTTDTRVLADARARQQVFRREHYGLGTVVCTSLQQRWLWASITMDPQRHSA